MRASYRVLKPYPHILKSVWGKRILAAESRGAFTESEIRMAGDWTTCACGEQDPKIPRSRYRGRIMGSSVGAPIDDNLRRLGVDFFSAVENNEFKGAAEILFDIENRATQVGADFYTAVENNEFKGAAEILTDIENRAMQALSDAYREELGKNIENII